MKVLNILIALLVVSIIVSGGFLAILILNQSQNPTPEPSQDGSPSAIITPEESGTPTQIISITPPTDNTADACANLFSQSKGSQTQLADIQFNFTSNTTHPLKIGDKVIVTMKVLNLNPNTIWKGMELRLLYPCDTLKFIKATPPASGEYMSIQVNSSYDNIAEAHIASTKDNFVQGDEIISLEFEVLKEGNPFIEVADTSTILDNKNQKFSISTNNLQL